MGKELLKVVDKNQKEPLLTVVDMNQAKEFAEVLKALALEYDLISGAYPETEYEGYSVLEFFVQKYIKEPLGFNRNDWIEELLAIAKARKVERRVY